MFNRRRIARTMPWHRPPSSLARLARGGANTSGIGESLAHGGHIDRWTLRRVTPPRAQNMRLRAAVNIASATNRDSVTVALAELKTGSIRNVRP